MKSGNTKSTIGIHLYKIPTSDLAYPMTGVSEDLQVLLPRGITQQVKLNHSVHCNKKNVIHLQICFFTICLTLWKRVATGRIKFSSKLLTRSITDCNTSFWQRMQQCTLIQLFILYNMRLSCICCMQNIFLIHYTKIHFCLLIVKGFSAKHTVYLSSSI